MIDPGRFDPLAIRMTEVDFGTPLYDEAVGLRDLVLRKPLGLSFSVADIMDDISQRHFVLYDASFAVLGTVTIKPLSPETWQMRQVAIRQELRGYGLGAVLVDKITEWARSKGARSVMAQARVEVVPFYEKRGYRTMGKPYDHIGIAHQDVTIDLTADR